MIRITLPVYFSFAATKNRKIKTVLVSSNWFRNAHFFHKNQVKSAYHELAISRLNEVSAEPIEGIYKTRYIYYYKNKGSDGSNVVSMIEKFFLDALQGAKIVKEDNVLFHSSDGFICREDKANPRIEIEVYKDES